MSDIVAEIIQREEDGIAGATEVRAGIEIIKLRSRLASVEARLLKLELHLSLAAPCEKPKL